MNMHVKVSEHSVAEARSWTWWGLFCACGCWERWYLFAIGPVSTVNLVGGFCLPWYETSQLQMLNRTGLEFKMDNFTTYLNLHYVDISTADIDSINNYQLAGSIQGARAQQGGGARRTGSYCRLKNMYNSRYNSSHWRLPMGKQTVWV